MADPTVAAGPRTGTGKSAAAALAAGVSPDKWYGAAPDPELVRLTEYTRLVNKQHGRALQMELYDPALANKFFVVTPDWQLRPRARAGLGDCQAATRAFLTAMPTSDGATWHIVAALIRPQPGGPAMLHILCVRGRFRVTGDTRISIAPVGAPPTMIITLQSGMKKTIPFEAWWKANRPEAFIHATYDPGGDDAAWDEWDEKVYELNQRRDGAVAPPFSDLL